MTRRFIVFALPLTLALAVPSLGCGGTVATEPAVANAPTTRAPVAQSAHGHIKVLGEALGDVPLTAAQRSAIEQLATDAEARQAASRTARHDLIVALAAQIEAGRVDRAALQPRVDALVAAHQATQPADRAALEQLHALLGPDQRTAFVDAVEARVSQRMGAMHDKHPLAKWAADLGLTEDQKSQIRDAMKQRFQAMHAEGGFHGKPPWAEGHHQGAKVMEAFKQDRFVMAEVAPPQDLAAKATAMCDHMLGVAEVALPVLTPQQRTIAAQKLREHADSLEELHGLP
jgi:Spy/CpxP family protein refolding chaperone